MDLRTGRTSLPILLPECIKCELPGALRRYLQGLNISFDSVREVALFQGLKVTAQGSAEGVEFHANPSVEGKPWFDSVQVLEYADEEGLGPIYYAGTCVTFVRVLVSPATEDEDVTYLMLVVLHMLRASALMSKRERHARQRERNTGRDRRYTANGSMEFDIDHKLCYIDGHRRVPFPVMSYAYHGNGGAGGGKGSSRRPVLNVYDSEHISSGLWTHRDFDDNNKYWVIRSPLMIPPSLQRSYLPAV
jgi:hypothetical protein